MTALSKKQGNSKKEKNTSQENGETKRAEGVALCRTRELDQSKRMGGKSNRRATGGKKKQTGRTQRRIPEHVKCVECCDTRKERAQDSDCKKGGRNRAEGKGVKKKGGEIKLKAKKSRGGRRCTPHYEEIGREWTGVVKARKSLGNGKEERKKTDKVEEGQRGRMPEVARLGGHSRLIEFEGVARGGELLKGSTPGGGGKGQEQRDTGIVCQGRSCQGKERTAPRGGGDLGDVLV